MKKKYFEPEFEMTLFSFERIMQNFADIPNDPNDPKPEFP